MTIADSKRTTDTSTKTKHAAEPTSKPSTPKTVTVVRRPVSGETSAETIAPKPDAATKPKKPTTYEARMRALAPVVRLRRKLEANVKRLSKIANEVSQWQNASELRDAATSVTTALAAMMGIATALPHDFKPARVGNAGSRQLVPGSKAGLRPKVAAKYEGILEPDERENLEIVSIARGGLVSVKTVRGARVVLPRAHIAKRATDEGTSVRSGAASVEPASSAPTQQP